MKVKVYVIDVQVPTALKKWGLLLGIPTALLVVGGVAFAGNVPYSFATGQTLTAAELNGNFSYLQSELDTVQAGTSGVGTLPFGAYVNVSTATPPVVTVKTGSAWVRAVRTGTGALTLTPTVTVDGGAGLVCTANAQEFDIVVTTNTTTPGSILVTTYAGNSSEGSPIDSSFYISCSYY